MFVKISTDNIMQKVRMKLVDDVELPESMTDTIVNRTQQELHDELSNDADRYANTLENEVADSIVNGPSEKTDLLLSIFKEMGEIKND